MNSFFFGWVLLLVVSSDALAQSSDKILERCFSTLASASDKRNCRKELVGKTHEFSGLVIAFIGDRELKIDHPYGFFSHTYITAAFAQKIPSSVTKGQKIVVVGTVESIFDDALNPMVSLRSARLK